MAKKVTNTEEKKQSFIMDPIYNPLVAKSIAEHDKPVEDKYIEVNENNFRNI